DVRHPDIMRFVVMKRDLTKVTGANISVMLTDEFMNTVEQDGDWICRWPIEGDPAEVIEKGGKWINVKVNPDDPLGFPLDHKVWISNDPEEKRVLRMVKAKKLWHLINESATLCAEPGLLFWDNYGNNLPAHKYKNFKLIC
ncbi:hypothetical protein ACI4B7_25865, partial [Klebsiella pneumoniae]|uniref:hypothetical protein n=1 Tax=Klebsiella pneumoniae TaxID=573 RepID=UPI00385245DD